jgi:sec-independent protein translocase protein TatA
MMGSLSIWHWLIFGLVAVVVFGGRGRLSSIMGDAAKGIRAFQDGLKGDGEGDKPASAPSVLPQAEATREASKDTAKS